MTQSHDDSIIFLGTGGARIMVAHQILASGGLWLSLSGQNVLVDPGPGCIVQVNKRKLRAETLDAVLLSHRHLDHSGDVNVMIEAMTGGGFRGKGRFYAPADAFGPEPVMFSYLKKYLEEVIVLEEGGKYALDGLRFETPLKHRHPVETYGIVFHSGGKSITYITDTRYFDGLADAYKESDLLIINVVLTEPRPTIDHLTLADAEKIIDGIKPKAAILTHFGMNVWRAHPWEAAAAISERTGIRVIAARDGMVFQLSNLDTDVK
ncbi:Metal-dependent hydrolases of the beta-lactamase superfamily III [Dehalogenimonas alkenigignens]|uniref:Metal-dependent hydrolases of the beta-lactamase superfamily III n=1 Tax=Dehalogenimonas alkenigignens TaxID=1217799 RepID=A0A0W0GGQ8_9CHLR|nr:MBL fold metallo-hydrolase [Dehalogenimonas alkenigignens]KTB47725.1 Metal-dependent hydrolases of the beta-lactamase superfamily III [Dehalogenimonas alkenigignens]